MTGASEMGEHEGLSRELQQLWGWLGKEAADSIVSLVVSAGYRKPRTITTMDELLALNDQAVIKTRYTFMQVDAEHSERVYLTEFGDESSWPVRRNKPRDYGEFLPAVVLDEGKGRC